METLYDILEVSRKASPEVIDKAYKTLAKKYHPDLKTGQEKIAAEAKMKKLNEAYSVLSDEEKRKKYDEKIRIEEKAKIEEQKNEIVQNYTNKEDENEDWRNLYSKLNSKEQRKLRKKIEREVNEEYINRYEQYYRSLGYNVKHKWTRRECLTVVIIIAILFVIFFVLWKIPKTHDSMLNLYNENIIIKIIVNIIIGIFNSIGKFVKTIFKF